MAELAAHGATLRKNDKADSRSIDRAEGFELVDSSESHDVKIKNEPHFSEVPPFDVAYFIHKSLILSQYDTSIVYIDRRVNI